MHDWVLIISIMWTAGGGGISSTTNIVDGFSSEESCQKAILHATADIEAGNNYRSGTDIRTSCVERK
jgi:hypothetical protein